MIENIFRERLSLCLNAKHMTGAELSALSGTSEAAISRYLCGLRSPTIDNLVRIATALNVSTDYLLGLNDAPDSNGLVNAYSSASDDDRRVIWTLLERYGGNHVNDSDRN